MPPSRTPTPKRRPSLVPKTPPSHPGTKLVVVKTIMPQRTASGWTLKRPFLVTRRVPIEPESTPTSTAKSESMDDGVAASPSPSPSLATEAGHRFTGAVSATPSGRASSITLPVRAKVSSGIARANDAASATAHGPGPGASFTLPMRTVSSKGSADTDGDVEMKMAGEEHGDDEVKREEAEE